MTEQDLKKVLDEARTQMQKALEHFESELSKIRAGKASSAMLDGILVEAYGTRSPLIQVGNISTPDARTITIQPWDPSLLQPIEKAILAANIGLTPQNDGKIIRLNLPPLTEERRKELVKQTKAEAEHCRIALRNARKDALDKVRKLQKEGLPEDVAKNGEQSVQHIIDEFNKKVDKHLEVKEKEIMTV
ncbi:MAG: ribosome recycling factor [Chitinophagales bacterium]|nr:ribosome recycling factor [Chitinophagales bacterium]MDW8419017.1 ribosome recycling factor [Chitinophagales bacterium]